MITEETAAAVGGLSFSFSSAAAVATTMVAETAVATVLSSTWETMVTTAVAVGGSSSSFSSAAAATKPKSQFLFGTNDKKEGIAHAVPSLFVLYYHFPVTSHCFFR